MENLKMETPDTVENNVEKIGALFPAAVTEMRGEDGKLHKGIDFEKLKQLLSRDIVDGGERYEFSWVGKKAAMAEAARPTTETLRPVKADSRNWDTTENLYIEGDNLAVLKILQESYLGKVKMIYIDPPYNTGNDYLTHSDNYTLCLDKYNEIAGFIDSSNYTTYYENRSSNPRFHSDWCSMMYERLIVARTFLSEDGVIFISIDDNEMVGLRNICNEIFGVSNFIAQFCWKSKPQGGNDNKHIVSEHEYIVVYAKNVNSLYLNGQPHNGEKYKLKDDYYNERGGYALAKLDNSVLEYRVNLDYPVECPDHSILYPGNVSHDEWERRHSGGNSPRDWQWRWSPERLKKAIELNLCAFKKGKNGNWTLYSKEYEKVDNNGNPIERSIKYRTIIDQFTTMDGTKAVDDILGRRIFVYPKPPALMEMLAKIGLNKNNTVLDFFSGSATTAHAVMQLNAEDGGHRKFIMVQLAEPCDEKSEAYKAGYKNICEIGKERIRRAGDKIKAEHPDADLDIGFRVFRVDSSNMQDVYYKPEEFTQTMLGETVSNIKPDRTDLDLLYACLLDCGVAINLPHTTQTVDGCTIHNVDNGALMACFDEHIPQSVIRAMAAETPLQAIFRDSAFAADADKINVTEIFKNLSPDTKVRVI